jgi:hypothetical protein
MLPIPHKKIRFCGVGILPALMVQDLRIANSKFKEVVMPEEQ